jgi:DNA-binding PadR family transcriptional regulator
VELNSTAASLLGFLHDGPMSGWELASAVEATIGNFWNVTRSQVYRELRTLGEARLVKPGDRGPRGRQRFVITAAGRRAFASWIARPPGQELIRFPLLLTLFFADHLEEEQIAEFIETHRRRHEERLARYKAMFESSDSDAPRVQTLRFGIAYQKTLLKWLDSLPWKPRQRDGPSGRAGRVTPSRRSTS